MVRRGFGVWVCCLRVRDGLNFANGPCEKPDFIGNLLSLFAKKFSNSIV